MICASIILGMKIGECLKKIEDVVLMWRKHLRKLNKKEMVDEEEETLERLKHRVLEAEVYLMITFGFDLDIKLAVEYLKEVEGTLDAELYKQTRRQITNFYKTELVSFNAPHLVALAALKIASKMSKISITTGEEVWYKVFSDLTTEKEVDRLVEALGDYLKEEMF